MLKRGLLRHSSSREFILQLVELFIKTPVKIFFKIRENKRNCRQQSQQTQKPGLFTLKNVLHQKLFVLK